MNLARSLERRLERLIEGLASKLFPGTVSAPELAQRLIREADLSVTEGAAGPVAPNVYGVRMNLDDLGSPSAPAELTSELAAVIDLHCRDNGWRLEGEVHVEIATDASMSAGSVHVVASVVPGRLERWAYLVIKRSGDELNIEPNRCLVGRDVGNDVRIEVHEVSRTHALIWREGVAIWIADLGSSNGTTVNGSSITAPVPLANGDAVVFGPTETTFRLA